jgi:hypothetical protein
MAQPVLVLVDDEDGSRQALARELELRYGAHYRIVSGSSPELALARLRAFRAEGVAVPLVLAGQWMPGMRDRVPGAVKDVMPRHSGVCGGRSCSAGCCASATHDRSHDFEPSQLGVPAHDT